MADDRPDVAPDGHKYVDLAGLKARNPGWRMFRPVEPFDEVEVEDRYARRGAGRCKPYVVVSVDALAGILVSLGFDPGEAAEVLTGLADRAQMAGNGEEGAVRKFYAVATALTSPPEAE